MTKEITIPINCENLDDAIEKADRLVELLKEARKIIDSLSGKKEIFDFDERGKE